MIVNLFHPLLFTSLFLAGTLTATAVEISAKAVRYDKQGDEEHWGYEIEIDNTSRSTIGNPVLQYLIALYPETGPDGSPESELEGTPAKLALETLPPGKQTLKTPPMTFAIPDGVSVRPKTHILQGIRVRVWQNGRLLGEFSEAGKKVNTLDWPLQQPAVPSGSEAGPGPWLLVTEDTCNFGGLTFGASGASVVEKLKGYGDGAITARPTPLHTHPFSIRAAQVPGCAFAFDADKKLALVEVTVAGRAKLPGDLVLGASTPEDFAEIFGTPEASDLVIENAGPTQKCQLSWGQLHWWGTAASPEIITGIAVQKK